MPRTSSTAAELVIAVPPERTWAALVQPTGRRHWLNDAVVTSTWAPGAEIEIDVVLEGIERHDRGTVLLAEAPHRLRYSLWSSISRRPDTPEHRSVVTFELTPTPDGGTRLGVEHTALGAAAAAPHAAFFWPVALGVLRDELEGRSPATRRLARVGDGQGPAGV